MKIVTTGLVALSAALALAGSATHAAPQNKPKSCMDTAETQLEMDKCARQNAQEADQRLNKAYQGVMCHLDADEKKQLVAAQRAWIAFRDADCGFWAAGGGSISPMNHAFCIADLSDARAKELDSWPPNAPRDALVPCDGQ